jgi:hypothetical protein
MSEMWLGYVGAVEGAYLAVWAEEISGMTGDEEWATNLRAYLSSLDDDPGSAGFREALAQSYLSSSGKGLELFDKVGLITAGYTWARQAPWEGQAMVRSSRTSIIPDAGYVPGDPAAYGRPTACARRSLQMSVKQELTAFLPGNRDTAVLDRLNRSCPLRARSRGKTRTLTVTHGAYAMTMTCTIAGLAGPSRSLPSWDCHRVRLPNISLRSASSRTVSNR